MVLPEKQKPVQITPGQFVSRKYSFLENKELVCSRKLSITVAGRRKKTLLVKGKRYIGVRTLSSLAKMWGGKWCNTEKTRKNNGTECEDKETGWVLEERVPNSKSESLIGNIHEWPRLELNCRR